MAVRTTIVAALTLAALPAAAQGANLPDVSGIWTGTGFVQKDENSRPINVKCEIEGEATGERVAFDGACRAMLVMKRAIGAKLEPSGDTLVGTYEGAAIGIAQLRGDWAGPGRLVLEMTFPREVNGDDKAVMQIDAAEEDAFTITTVDTMLSGVDVVTSQIRFEREDEVAGN